MAFLSNDDDGAFQAALSFVDEFAFDEKCAEHLPSSTQLQEDAASPPQCDASVILNANEFNLRRRKQRNERRRLLRKAGIYADPNRVRNERRQEIARLREQLEQLQVDVQVLRRREATRPQDAAGQMEDPPSSVNLTPQAPAVWQELATRQRYRRDEAERESIRLKLVVERQRRVAENLDGLVRRRALQVVNLFLFY